MQFIPVDNEQFHAAVQFAMDVDSRISDTLTAYTIRSYDFMDCYLSEDGKSGYAINIGGELVSVFSLVRGRGDELMESAIANGARRLHCFDCNLYLYLRNGFVIADTYTSKSNINKHHMILPRRLELD